MLQPICMEDVVEIPLSVACSSKTVALEDCTIVSRDDLQLLKSISKKRYPTIKLFKADLPYSEYGKDVALSLGYIVGYNRKHKDLMHLYTQVY